MMKRLIVMGIIAAMVMGFAASASAVIDTKWVVQLRVTDLSGMNYGTTNAYGLGTASTGTGSLTGPIVMMYVTGTDPKQVKDVRTAPSLTEPPSKIEWNLTVEAAGNYTSTKFRLAAWNPSGTNNDIDANIGLAPQAGKIRIYHGEDLEYTFDSAVNGAQATPMFTKDYDIVAGGTTGFRLVYEIPEPGSIVALMSGLVGLAGFAVRRRK